MDKWSGEYISRFYGVDLSDHIRKVESDLLLELVLAWILITVLFVLVFKKKSNCSDESDPDMESTKQVTFGLETVPTISPLFPLKFIGRIEAPDLFPLSKLQYYSAIGWTNNKKYGDVMTFHRSNLTFVLMNLPELPWEPDHLIKSSILTCVMQPFIHSGVAVSNGWLCQKQRNILMQAKKFQALKDYMGLLNKHNERFINTLEKLFEDGGLEHPINSSINELFINIISKVVSGKEMDSNEFHQYRNNFETWHKSLAKCILNPWLLWEPIWKLNPMGKDHDKAVAESFEFAKKKVKKCKDKRVNATADEMETHRCVIDELIDAGMDDDLIVNEVNAMIFGTHETGSSGIIQKLCLTLNPETQKECRREIGLSNCLDLKLAMLELKIITTYIFHHFEMTHPDKLRDVPLIRLITIKPPRD